MSDSNEIEFLDQTFESIHQFHVDLNRVVLLNYGFALAEMTRAEQENEDRLENELAHEQFDHETAGQMRGKLFSDYEEYRQAARQLALVGVVTRLQHWIGQFVEGLPNRPQKLVNSWLIKQLEFLNRELGNGPFPLPFFEDLVTVRDSIVHADSRAKWNFERDREVAARYQNAFGKVELSESQLQEAIDKAVGQVAWYDERTP
jgi:hypothetical protein